MKKTKTYFNLSDKEKRDVLSKAAKGMEILKNDPLGDKFSKFLESLGINVVDVTPKNKGL